MGVFDRNYSDGATVSPQPIPIRPTSGEPGAYPIEWLGPRLKAAAEAIVDKVQVPTAIAAQSVLGAAAVAVQPFIDIILPTRERAPVSLFMITVAASGDRKSSADKLALSPIRLRERDLHREYEQAQAIYVAEKAAYVAATKKATTGSNKTRDDIRAALEDCGKEPVAPPQPLILSDEGTFQGLQKLFADAMPSLGLFSDEGGQWLGGYSMNEENRGQTGAGLSKLWDGAPIKRVRGTDGVTILRGRRLSLHLMIQPNIAKKLFNDEMLLQQGLMSRMLVCQPVTLKGQRLWHEPKPESDEALLAYQNRLEGLLRLPLPMLDPTTRELDPVEIELSPEAAEMWKQFADFVEKMIGPDGELEPIAGFAAKLPEHAVRIAAVMAFFEDKSMRIISPRALAAGIEIAKFYAAEALRLFGVGSTDEDTENAAQLVEFIRKKKLTQVGLRHLTQKVTPAKLRPAPVIRRAIQVLVENKHLVAIEGGALLNLDGKEKFYRDAWAVIQDNDE